MPSFRLLFKETVILLYIWNNEFCLPYVPARALRTRDRFTLPRVRTRYGKRVRAFYVPDVLNDLPDKVLSSSTRKEVKSYIFDLYV